MVFLESFLKRMEWSSFRSLSLDGGEAVFISLHCKDSAALDALAIHQDGAGSAAAGVASDMRSGHIEDLADHVNEQQPGFNLQLMMRAIYGD
jgi:hypothetical protein